MVSENMGATLRDLESEVENLATSVMAGSGEQGLWLAGLEKLLHRAAASEVPNVSGTATELLDELVSAPSGDRRSGIESALIRLQAELEAAEQSSSANTATALAQDPELVADFIVEARDHLTLAESHLLALEQEEDQPDAIHAIFRAYHTIKGLAGFLELQEVREVSHEIETLLDFARNGRLAISPEVTDAVLAGTDFLRQWLKYLEITAGEPVPGHLRDVTQHITNIRALCPGESDQAAPREVIAPGELRTIAEAEPQAPVERQTGPEAKPSRARAVKVDTEKLDYLVDMVGEMVIAQSMLRYDPAAQTPQLTRNMTQLARITDEVQRTAMSMRMIPLEGLFQRMARLVRDLARKSGKRAQLELSGEEVELDRNIVEELGDPLMHMIRNAMDHGVESPEARIAAGKPPVARIDLKAFHLSGQIVIQVSDDGRGLDRNRILAKARTKGLLAEGATLSENEAINLIFEPGFSTAEQISDISGRGVGMDVVRKQIQKLRGIIEVQSKPGEGTEFSLRLPLTMAIIDGLLVTVGPERFIVPIFAVKEMLRPTAEMLSTIEGSAEVVLVRNKLLPMVRLHDRFAIQTEVTNPADGVLVIAEGDGRPFALLVDQVLGKQEVVIKTLGRLFQDVEGVAGGAILGDGRVGLILDMQRVFA